MVSSNVSSRFDEKTAGIVIAGEQIYPPVLGLYGAMTCEVSFAIALAVVLYCHLLEYMQDSSWLVLSALSRKNPIFSSQTALGLETVEVVENTARNRPDRFVDSCPA